MNIDNLDRFVKEVLAQSMNCVAAIVGGGSVFVQLTAIIGILSSVKSISAAKALEELKSGIDSAEMEKLKADFKAALVLPNAVLEKKIEAGVDLFDEAVKLVEEGMLIYEKAKVLFENAKSLITA